MRISDLAAEAGVTVKAVRYYESQGLLKPRRESNGYRAYDEDDVIVVREVKALLSLGLTAEQTYPFIECLRAGNERADVWTRWCCARTSRCWWTSGRSGARRVTRLFRYSRR